MAYYVDEEDEVEIELLEEEVEIEELEELEELVETEDELEEEDEVEVVVIVNDPKLTAPFLTFATPIFWS